MRRMYSEKQIKNLFEKDLSNIVVTKGQYTSDVTMNIIRLGNCTTIAGSLSINNTSENTDTLAAFTFNAPFSINVETNVFVFAKRHNNTNSLATGYLNLNENNDAEMYIDDVPVGESNYYFNFDIIDNEPLPVKDYPGE